MRVLFITPGGMDEPCSRVRALQYFPGLALEGIEPHAHALLSDAGWHRIIRSTRLTGVVLARVYSERINSIARLLTESKNLESYAAVVILRTLLPKFVQSLLLQKNDRLIYDFDDAVWLPPPAMRSNILRKLLLPSRAGSFHRLLSASRAVITASPILADYAGKFNANVSLIYSSVDTQRVVPRGGAADAGLVTIGWMGTPSNLSYVDAMSEALNHVCAKFPNVRIRLVGGPPNALGVHGQFEVAEWSLDREVVDLQSFDIGIMPVPDDPVARAKGGYKLFQYMAVGIPCVASPIGINSDIVQHGKTGFLASTPEEWESSLHALVADPKLRREMGHAGRDRVQEYYSAAAMLPRLVNVIKAVATS